MGNSAQVVVLAEDQQHQNFAYHWLRRRGFGVSQIRLLPLPAGRGAGEQYVRENYVHQLKEQRRRAASMKCHLVVVVDADMLPVQQRHQQLDEALQQAGLAQRSTGEQVCVLIPKRNVETWIHYLVAGPVDEATDYKPKTADECRQASRVLAESHALAVVPEEYPPSLQQGWRELKQAF